jgi:aspartate aminotransferase/aminotransferase
MSKLKQQTFVCAPSAFQRAVIDAHDIDLEPMLKRFTTRRDMIVDLLGDVTQLTVPDGSFFAFPEVPKHLGLSGSEFVAKAIDHDVLVIQGNIFSSRDTHFRISFAAADDRLEKGLGILRTMLS